MIITRHTGRCIRWGHYCMINKETSVYMVYSSQRGWASLVWLLLHLTASFPFPALPSPPLSSISSRPLPSPPRHALPPISSPPLPFPSFLSHLLPFHLPPLFPFLSFSQSIFLSSSLSFLHIHCPFRLAAEQCAGISCEISLISPLRGGKTLPTGVFLRLRPEFLFAREVVPY